MEPTNNVPSINVHVIIDLALQPAVSECLLSDIVSLIPLPRSWVVEVS